MKRVQVAGSVVACVALLLAVKSPQASEAARQAENLVTDIWPSHCRECRRCSIRTTSIRPTGPAT